MSDIETEEHALYRFFGADDALLYIGISIHPFARMGQHQGDKSWWGEVVKVTIERHPTRADVVAAERVAIRAEGPRYNIVHAGRARDRRPPVKTRLRYWEPTIGEVICVPNVVPMVEKLGTFVIPWDLLSMQCGCGANLMVPDEITEDSFWSFRYRCTCGARPMRLLVDIPSNVTRFALLHRPADYRPRKGA